jgi:hypothetical protein
MSIHISSLTSDQLRRAAGLKEKIDALYEKLASMLGAPALVSAKAPKKYRMSAAGRTKIAAAQKARWAKVKAAKPAKAAKKRKMSAAAKAKISAAAKARWAKVKAAGKKSL